MHSPLRRIALSGLVMYALVCLTLFAGATALSGVREWLPRWVGFILITLVGPAMFLAPGLEGWSAFAVVIFTIFGCLAWAHRLWRQFPQEEWFVLPLMAAIGLWATSGWFVVALAVYG
jgi:hypothetical protein